ncbi:unnamed protein product [Knipowitschia caucasica]|uniref:D(1B) dopamine receptor n=1 Tax=Knipowitschia caucasica TaxID=637954 RepID=A0AAV2M5C4_KNICA
MEPARYLSAEKDVVSAAPPPREVTWNVTHAHRTEVVGRCVTGAFLSLLILWTLCGNVLVCSAVLRFRHLRSKVTNIFIVSLALSDLLVALLVMPWKAVAEVTGHWPFGAFCDVWVAFDIMCSTASILNLCMISMDRYWAISAPFRYERKMTQRAAFVMIGVSWTLSVLISFIPVQLQWHKAAGAEQHVDENCDSSLSRTYAISSSLVSFYIPVAIMIVTYTRIYRIAQMQIRRIATLERAAEHAQSCRMKRLECVQHSSLKSSLKRETKVLKTLSVIMGVFVCCWLPFFVLNCLVPFCEKPGAHRSAACVSDTTFNVFVWFGWTNSSLNPVIYAFNAEFRKAFASLLGCRVLCRTPVQTVNISNELVSYNQDTLIHRDLVSYDQSARIHRDLVSYDQSAQIHREIVSAYASIIPNVVDCLNDDFDRISQLTQTAHDPEDLVCETDI